MKVRQGKSLYAIRIDDAIDKHIAYTYIPN
jgi:hypothetical protein